MEPVLVVHGGCGALSAEDWKNDNPRLGTVGSIASLWDTPFMAWAKRTTAAR